MGRLKSDTVSYFPHYANASSKDTLKVLEGQFGNDGFTFWFKLLEKLCSSEGHYLDCRNRRKWNVLLADSRVDDKTGVEIMVLLVEMEAIDKELWESHVIWCQKLVDNLAEVYKNRKRELPQKPVITGNKVITTVESPEIVPEIPQRRGEGRGGEEIKSYSSSDIAKSYEQEIGKTTPVIKEEIKGAIELFGAEAVQEAIKITACAGDDKRNWRYVVGVLQKKHPEKVNVYPSFDSEINPEAEAIWIKALAALEKQVTRSYYRTWLRETYGIKYQDGVFYVGAHNAFVAEYLNQMQRSLIEKTLIELTGDELQVKFKVMRR